MEGPWLLHWSQYFFLLYSTGGGYADTSYSIWAARATNLTGPYTKATQVSQALATHCPICPHCHTLPSQWLKWTGQDTTWGSTALLRLRAMEAS